MTPERKNYILQLLKSTLLNGRFISEEKIKRDKKVGILYLSSQEREHYQITIQNGKFCYEKSGRPISAMTHLLFNWSQEGLFYGKEGLEWKNYGRGYFGHGSFTGSSYARAAGEWMIDEHQNIRIITNNTGHYLTSPRQMRRMLFALYAQGIDLKDTILVLYQHTFQEKVGRGRFNQALFFNALEYLHHHSDDCHTHYEMSAVKEIRDNIRAATDFRNSCLESFENTKPHRCALLLFSLTPPPEAAYSSHHASPG